MSKSKSGASEEWTILYIENVQKEYRRRQELPTNFSQIVKEYQAAAERKINQALSGYNPQREASTQPSIPITTAGTPPSHSHM